MLLASLLIVLAQFATVVHAADHLFHAEDVICAAYNSAEHDKSLQHSPTASITTSIACSNAAVFADSVASTACNADYLSRAPPQITI